MPSIFKMMKDEKKLNSIDYIKLWNDKNRNFEKVVEEIIKQTNLDRDVCIKKLTSEIFKEYPIASTFYKFKYNIEDTVDFIYEDTGYDYQEILTLISDLNNQYIENDKRNSAVYERNKKIVEERKNHEMKQNNNLRSYSEKEIYKANKKAGIVSCPKCGSTSITTTNKKISVGKGAVGAAVGSIVNPVGTIVGAAVGATHSKKIYNVCMNCGHRWKP